MNSTKREIIIADGHVHFHECFDIKNFFKAAWDNFFAESNKLGFEESFTGVLFLTESFNANWFLRFVELSVDGLKFERTREKNSLKAKFDDEKELILIAGRQIVSKENLEVLALGIDKIFGEGEPVSEIIRETVSRGGIPVIPWGVGKWMGKRGLIVTKLIKERNPSNYFLGDNSGRPIFWKNPSHFNEAKQRDILVLPGSDPLPFPSEYKKVGSFGFVIRDEVDLEFPAESIKLLLSNSENPIQLYGTLENPIRFFKNQFLMQLNKLN